MHMLVDIAAKWFGRMLLFLFTKSPNPESEPLGSVRHNISREYIYGKGSSIFHIKAFRTLSKRLTIRISITDSCSLVYAAMSWTLGTPAQVEAGASGRDDDAHQ